MNPLAEQESRVSVHSERAREIEAAYDLVRAFSVQFEQGMKDENGLEIYADKDGFWNLATSFVDDLRRYREYHETEMPDRARRAAYLAKWIMKFRPITAFESSADKRKEVRTFELMANEVFAMMCMSGVMMFDWDNISDRMRVILLYSLRHRFNSEDTYILFLAQLCDL